ncbi:MAG: DsbA family protein [Rhodospirillales bacterium]|jgi:protein-disulfide isomerase|nr:DsbA family protein [Rhodospirillales bacterium]
MPFLRIAPFVLSLFLLAPGPAAAGDDTLGPDHRKAIEQVVREYLENNPEILVDALKSLREKQEAKQKERSQAALASRQSELENDPATPFGGNIKGNVTVVEFFDYQCGYCKRVRPVVEELLRGDGNIRIVFKEFPILGAPSVIAARAALAAWKQDHGGYNKFHFALMATKGRLSEEKIMAVAAKSGLDVERLRRDMAAPEIDEALQKNFRLAEDLGIRGTPAFVIGKRLVPGAIDLKAFQKLIAEARRG